MFDDLKIIKMLKAKRGQTAVEYLLLIGAAIIFVVAVVYVIKTQVLGRA